MINWKNASYCGAGIYYFLISLVTPVITMYFIKLVDGSIFASINVMAIAMAAIVQTISTKEKVRKILIKLFPIIILLDSVLFVVLSVEAVSDANIRFIGMTLLSTSLTAFCGIVIDSMVNNKVNGEELTTYRTTRQAIQLWSGFAGGLLCVFFIDYITINTAIYIECLANSLYSVADFTAYKRLKV